MSEKQTHYVPPSCEQWVVYRELPNTRKELESDDVMELAKMLKMTWNEWVEGYVGEAHLVIAWGFTETGVPWPIVADIGQDTGEYHVGRTPEEAKANATRKEHFLSHKIPAYTELQRRGWDDQQLKAAVS